MDPPESALTPALGRLSLFPREVRDEVYHHVFDARYLAPRSGVLHHCMDNYAGRRIRSSSRHGGFVCANIGIFKTSRVLREESAEIFYRECVFKFSISRILEDENDLALLHRAYDQYPIPEKEDTLRLLRQLWWRPKFGIDIPSAMNMRNIELCIDLKDYTLKKHELCKVHALDATTSHMSMLFGGSQPVRSSCRVVIGECIPQPRRQYHEGCFLKACEILSRLLASLVAFKSLIITTTTVGPEVFEHLKRTGWTAMRAHAEYSDRLSVIQTYLETVLGPSTAVDEFHGNNCLRSFTFHPYRQLKRPKF